MIQEAKLQQQNRILKDYVSFIAVGYPGKARKGHVTELRYNTLYGGLQIVLPNDVKKLS